MLAVFPSPPNSGATRVKNAASVSPCDRSARLPLVSLALPALRTLSREQWACIAPIIEQLIAADGQIDLFEFALRRIVTRRMDAQFNPHAGGVIQHYSFPPLAGDCAQLLSALANTGSGDARAVQAAYEEGFSRLPFTFTPPLVARDACGVQQIDVALTRLSQAVPHIKRVVLEACASTVASDDFITPDEAELLRAVAESLGCPLPPFIEGV